MKKFKKIIALAMAAMAAVSAMSMTALAAEDNSSDILSMSVQETRERGFEVIDGDIYDLNGNLIIDLTDGKTAEGFTLAPEFRVHDASEFVDASSVPMLLSASNPIYNGTKSLDLNTSGEQGKPIGSSFKATSSEPRCYFYYRSGTPTGVNFSVVNTSNDQIVDWISNLQRGKADYFTVYNSAKPNASYQVYASAEGSAGNATITVYTF